MVGHTEVSIGPWGRQTRFHMLRTIAALQEHDLVVVTRWHSAESELEEVHHP